MRLENKVALITGGTTGIGFATAELFLKEGAKVVITGKNPANLEAARTKLGPGVVVLEADAASIVDAGKVAAEIKKRFGGLDIAFLNAGIGQFVPAETTTEELYDSIFDVNVKGLFFQFQKILPLLREGGSVILNASVAAQIGFEGGTVYSATKAAVRSFARTFAAELVGRGIRVNSVSPGPIVTPIYQKMQMPKEAVKGFEDFMIQSNPMKRFGQPEEVATAVLFLASKESSYITGLDVPVDGGFTQL